MIWHLNDTSLPVIFHIIFAILNRYVDALIFASHRSLEYYSGYVKSNVTSFVIPSAVTSEFFEVPIKLEHKLAIKLGCVGNISEVKDIETFIKVCGVLKGKDTQ